MIVSMAGAFRLMTTRHPDAPAAIQRQKKWEPVPDPEAAGLNDRLTSFQATKFGVPITARVLNEGAGPRRRAAGEYQPVTATALMKMSQRPNPRPPKIIAQMKSEGTSENK